MLGCNLIPNKGEWVYFGLKFVDILYHGPKSWFQKVGADIGSIPRKQSVINAVLSLPSPLFTGMDLRP